MLVIISTDGKDKMIGLVFAMQEEYDKILPYLHDYAENHICGVSITTGTLCGKEICAMISGIGKTNAAIATTLLITQFSAKLIINLGIAGAILPVLKTGDVVISKSAVYHDVDATAFGYQHGQIPRMPTHYEAEKLEIHTMTHENFAVVSGVVCTGDTFLTSHHKILPIQKLFNDIAVVEMEAAAVAQTCHRFSLPFLMIKGISDHVDSKATENSENNLNIAMSNAINLLLRSLKEDTIVLGS